MIIVHVEIIVLYLFLYLNKSFIHLHRMWATVLQTQFSMLPSHIPVMQWLMGKSICLVIRNGLWRHRMTVTFCWGPSVQWCVMKKVYWFIILD